MSPSISKFDPDGWASDPDLQAGVSVALASDDLETALRLAFSLPAAPDPYVYRAMAAVTLAQAQRAVSAGRANGLHRWYLRSSTDATAASPATTTPTQRPGQADNTADAGSPPASDIAAYVSLFQPAAAPTKALAALGANAKKGSLRESVAANLTAKRELDADALGGTPTRRKKGDHWNPALDFWAWSCRALEWAGPCEEEQAENGKDGSSGDGDGGAARGGSGGRAHLRLARMAHPTLPLFMHHFGCVPPSWEAIEVIRLVVEGRRRKIVEERRRVDGRNGGNGAATISPSPVVSVCDVGSGNGYWTYMLRRHGLAVHAVDNGQSEFRSNWISDTERAEGARWLRERETSRKKRQRQKKHEENNSGSGDDADVLLLVYPVVGADFTRAMLHEYGGRDIVVAGTQNANGYTGFADMTMDRFVATEMPSWRKTVQIPLPSFAGKDEALFVFRSD